MKKGLVISDLHCGHEVGLTPPNWDGNKGTERQRHLYKLRRSAWRWFDKNIKELQPFDFTIANGDMIDGKGPKSGGTEQLYLDRADQSEMAVDILKRYKLGDIFMTFGTPYHTGDSEDWESQIAKAVKAVKIGGCDDLEVNGCIINYRHHIGRSSIPHGRATALLREALWNALWAERGEYPKANIIIRSHVHYYKYAGDGDQIAMTTPALQCYGTKLGTRRMTGTVDFGFVVLEIDEDGRFGWEAILKRFGHPKLLKLQT